MILLPQISFLHTTLFLCFDLSPTIFVTAAAAAKSLQSCPTLCDPIDGSPPGSSVPGILQARTLEWAAISFSSAWKWEVKVKWLSHARLCATPQTAAHQAPPSLGFSRQEHWRGLPFPLDSIKCRECVNCEDKSSSKMTSIKTNSHLFPYLRSRGRDTQQNGLPEWICLVVINLGVSKTERPYSSALAEASWSPPPTTTSLIPLLTDE